MVVAPDGSVSRKYAETRDGSGIREFTKKQRAVPRSPWYDGAVGTDATFSQRNSASFLQYYEEYGCRVQQLHKQGEGGFSC